MFEETGVQNFHVDRIRGRVKLETIQATWSGGTTVIDAANSSPGTACTGATALALVFKPGTFVQFLSPIVTGAAAPTSRITAFSASAGTATLTISAAPADGERIFITILIGRTG